MSLADVGTLLDGSGSALGGTASLVTGLLNAYQTNKARKNANKAIDKWESEASNMLDEAEANQLKLSSADDLSTYQQLKNELANTDYTYDFDQFDTSKYNVEDYVNENKDKILADVGKGVMSTAAGSGLGHSSGTLANIINAQTDKSEELYNNAYERMNTDKNFDYTAYQNYITNMQNKLNTQMQQTQNKLSTLSGDLKFDQETANNNLENRLSLGNSITQSKASLV